MEKLTVQGLVFWAGGWAGADLSPAEYNDTGVESIYYLLSTLYTTLATVATQNRGHTVKEIFIFFFLLLLLSLG